MEIRKSIGELKAGPKRIVVGGSPAEPISIPFRWSLLPSVSIGHKYLTTTKLSKSYWKTTTKIRLWIHYYYLLESLVRDLCQTVRSAKNLITWVPKCHLWKPLSSTLLLLSLLVNSEKQDSRYPSCFSVSESITHWTYCQLDDPWKPGTLSASFPVNSSYKHYTGRSS